MVEQGNEEVPHSALSGIQERLTIVMPESLNRFPVHRTIEKIVNKFLLAFFADASNVSIDSTEIQSENSKTVRQT